MIPKIMVMEEDWEDIKNEHLSFLLEGLKEGAPDPREGMLKTLVTQAMRY